MAEVKASDALLAGTARNEMIDGKSRGMPPFTPPVALGAVSELGWSLPREDLCLPALAISRSAYRNNIAALDEYAREQGVRLCCHGKTMMAPQLLLPLLYLPSVVGLCAATVPQATVMAETGADVVFIVNQIAGKANIARLAELVGSYPDKRFLCCVDSEEGIRQLCAWGADRLTGQGRVEVLVEIGVPDGRCGVRNRAAAERLVECISRSIAEGGPLRLAGVSTYEGAVPGQGAEWEHAVEELFELTRQVFADIAPMIDDKHVPIISAGGSATFDLAAKAFKNYPQLRGRLHEIWLRPGVAPVYDHVVYQERLAQLDARDGFSRGGERQSAVETFRPALALWAVVQSIPDRDVAIVAAGIRDFPIDAGFPTLIAHYRDGELLSEHVAGSHSITRANDQHAYLPIDDLPDVRVGDLLKFGISHPCTTFDRWPFLFMVDDEDRVVEVVKTYF